jgi:hypothetical protein
MNRYAFRYLVAVQVQPTYVKVGFVLLVSLGCWQLHLSPDDPTAPLATLLLWQMFAVSTGFRGAARAGFYDRLFTSGVARWRIAMMHWVTSAGPGAVAWLALTLIALAATGGRVFPVPLEVASVIAWVLVSTAGWAVGLLLPRLGAGVVWVTLMLLLGTTHAGLLRVRMLVNEDGVQGTTDAIVSGLTFVVCPFLLLGSPPASEDAWVRGLPLLTSWLALAAGVGWVEHAEVPLSAH